MHVPDRLLSVVARHWPFENGVGRIIDLTSRRPERDTAVRTVRTRHRFDIDVYAGDHIGRHLALSGQFDLAPVRALLRHARPGDVLLDIGANIGYVSCLFLHEVAGGRAICVEPQPGVFDLLARNLSRFGAARSEALHAALSDTHEETSLFRPDGNLGAASLHGSDTSERVAIQAVKASAFFARLERVDLVKVDTEGHEETIFRDAFHEIARLAPRAIQFEDRDGKSGPSGAIGKLMGDLGYTVQAIHKTLTRTGLSPARDDEPANVTDYIAVRR